MTTESGAMTGEQMLEHLLAMDPEVRALPLHFVYNYGDHWNTMVAKEVNKVELGRVSWNRRTETFEQMDERAIERAEADYKLAEAQNEDVEPGVLYHNGMQIVYMLLLT